MENERKVIAVSHCAICDEKETLYSDSYLQCFECAHVFDTEESLIYLDYLLQEEIAEAGYVDCGPLERKTGDTIWSCPLCLHDF